MGLLVVAARERGEVEQVARQPARASSGRPAAIATTSANISSIASAGRTSTRSARLVVAGVGERVHDAGRDLDHVAGLGDHGAQADAEAHPAGDDLEALGLDRVHVRHRHRAAGAQREVEREQLAAGAGGGVGEGEALARDRVLERLAGR